MYNTPIHSSMENIFKFRREGRYDDARLFLPRIGAGSSTKMIKSVVQTVKAS